MSSNFVPQDSNQHATHHRARPFPTIHLLGSEGFIGRALQREAGKLSLHCWSHRNLDPNHYFDLLDSSSWQPLLDHHPTHAILLSWPGLPNYQEPFHVARNLPASIELVECLVQSGLQRLVVAGTCYEYGLQNGQLTEDQLADPINCYAIAKDSLRRVIANHYNDISLGWCWARIFYPFGHDQNPNSLLSSLDRSIDHGDQVFSMGSGRQIRDYLHVNNVAEVLLRLANHRHARGIYNCGSGRPISLRELVEKRINKLSSGISLELGALPDRTDEPLAFWASMEKYNSLD